MSELMKDQLLLLVSRLSKSEKRFFSIFSQKHVIGEGNITNELYALAENAVLEIKDRTKKTKEAHKEYLMLAKKNPRVKSYLLDLILKALRAFHSEYSSDTIISSKLHEAELLMEKSMTQLAKKKLKQAAKLTSLYQKPIYTLRINDMLQRIILMRDTVTEDELLTVSQLYVEEKEAIKKISQETKLRTMNVSHYMGTIRLRKSVDEIMKEWDQEWEQLNKGNIAQLEHFAENYYVLGMLAKQHYIEKRVDESIKKFDQLMAVFDQLPKELLREKALTYSTALGNSLTPLMAKARFKKIEEVLNKLKQIEFKSTFRHARHDTSVAAFELNYLINFKKIDQAHEFAKNFMKEFLEGHPEVFYQHLLVAMNAAHVLFMYGNYKACNRLLNEIIHYQGQASKNLLINTYIFQVIVAIEQEKMDYGESLLAAFKRLIKKKKTTAFEKLSYGILFDIVYQKQSLKDKKFIRQSIRKIANTPLKGNHLQLTEFFDMYAWLMCKATSKKYIDCLP